MTHHDYRILPEKKYVRRAMNRIGKDIFPLLLKVKQADLHAQSTYQREEKQEKLDEICALYKEIVQENECVDLKGLAVTGSDLIAWGMKPGRELGEMLSQLLAIVIDDPGKNRKEALKEIFLELLK